MCSIDQALIFNKAWVRGYDVGRMHGIMLPLHASSLLVYIVDQWQISSALHPFDFLTNLFNFLVHLLSSLLITHAFSIGLFQY